MKRVALTLAAMGLLCLAANQAMAQRARAHSAAAHVTVGHGGHGAVHVGTLHHYRQVGHYQSGYLGHHRYNGHYGGYAHVAMPRYVPRYPVAVPYYGCSRPYAYPYYRPYRGFSYSGSGLSIGIGF